MVRRSAAVLALILLPSPLLAQEPQEREAGAHTVIRGETLWDLARLYYENPFDWRRIYQANTDRIEDPHWIYPGQIFVIPGVTPAQVQAILAGQGRAQGPTRGEMETPAPPPDRPAVAAARGGPCPTQGQRTVFYQGPEGTSGECPRHTPAQRTIFYDFSEEEAETMRLLAAEERPWMSVPMDIFYSSGWLVSPEADGNGALGRLAAFAETGVDEEERSTARPYERIHVTLSGSEVPAAGDLLQTFRVPRFVRGVGNVAVPTGLLTVTERTDSGLVATVANEYARVMLGDHVRMAPAFDLEPTLGAEPVQDGPTGTLLAFQYLPEVHQLGGVAFINLGADAGIQLGDEFVAYSRDDGAWPAEVAGRLQVVGVHPDHSTVRIVAIQNPRFRRGMGVRMVARLP